MISGTLVVGTLALVLYRVKTAVAVALPVCLLLVVWTKPLDLGRIPWSASYFNVNSAALRSYDNTTVLMWDTPNAYLVPFFPESATFLRLSDRWGVVRGAPMWMRVRDRVSRTRLDNLFFLETRSQANMEAKRRALLELGYQLDALRCQWIPSVTLVHRICGVRQWTQEASGAISTVSYGAAYDASAFAVAPGATLTVPVTVTNTGSLPWDAYGAFRLAYHWYNGSTLIIWDGLRTAVSSPVLPGGSLTLQASVKAPASAGTYILKWDMVEEFVTWFSIQNVTTKNLTIVVSSPRDPSGAGRGPE